MHEHVHRLLELRADEREHDARIPQQRPFVHLGQPEMILIIHSAFHRLLWAEKCGDQLLGTVRICTKYTRIVMVATPCTLLLQKQGVASSGGQTI